jgi:hypothetical protein
LISADRKHSTIVNDLPNYASTPSENSRLVFNKYGNEYFLAQVWTKGDSVARNPSISKRAMEVAQNSTGKSKRWNQTRVATARRNYSIAGQKHALPDPETVSLNEAARICGVSHRTIERLVEAGLLKREQVTARAPPPLRACDPCPRAGRHPSVPRT